MEESKQVTNSWANAANSKPVGIVVVIRRVDVRAVEVQVVPLRRIVRRRRPVVPVRSLIVNRTGIVVTPARSRKFFSSRSGSSISREAIFDVMLSSS